MDYIVVNGKHHIWSRDAKANLMIHMGSDHRSVMRFVIPAKTMKETKQRKSSSTGGAEKMTIPGA